LDGRIYLAVSSQDEAVATRFPKAHMAYRCGAGQLQTDRLPIAARGGLLVLRDQAMVPSGDPRMLARQVVQECVRRGYGGVLADFEESPDDFRCAALQTLSPALARRGLALTVPEPYGNTVPARVLVSSAISGGSLEQRLREVTAAFPGRVWLELRRLMMDFSLPCPTGEGTALTKLQLDALRNDHPGLSFYSADLGCHYFTYQADGVGHFVLFDTAESLARKWALAQSLGISTAILLYPESADLLPELEKLLL
jgi:hypothetical protein